MTTAFEAGQASAFREAVELAKEFKASLLPELLTIHRLTLDAHSNRNLPRDINHLDDDLRAIRARLEALVTSLGGGRYLDGEGWRR